MKVIIVGAGMFGASTAWHLVRQGASVTLVDRADAGRATAAGAGIVCPWMTIHPDPAYYAIASGGARYYPQLVADLAADGETDLGYRRVGSIAIPDDPAELDAIEQRLLTRQAGAPEMGEVRRLTPAQAVGLFPPLRHDRPGLHIAGTARLNGRLVAAAMLRAAQKRGAVVVEGEAELVVSNARAQGVRVNGSLLDADAVVVAAGAWAPALLAPLGITLNVVPQKGQIVHLRMNGTDTSLWPVLHPPASYYLLTFDDSRVVVGATREDNSGFDYRVTAKGQSEVLNVGLTVAPGLANAELIETRIGFRPMAPDNMPLLGPVPAIEGLLIGDGLGHSGLTLGPYAGRLLADATLWRTPDLDIGPFDPLRP